MLAQFCSHTLQLPPINDIDVTAGKSLALAERVKLSFYAQAFNVLNHANFQEPKTKIFDGSGNLILVSAQIPSPTATPERQIQFALKLTW